MANVLCKSLGIRLLCNPAKQRVGPRPRELELALSHHHLFHLSRSADGLFDTMAASDAENSPEESQFVFQSGDEDNLWTIEGIVSERQGMYKVKWAGNDPATGKPWGNSWVKKSDVTPDVVKHWKERQAKEQARKGMWITDLPDMQGTLTFTNVLENRRLSKASKKSTGSTISNGTSSTLRPGHSSVATTAKRDRSASSSRLSASPPPKTNGKRKAFAIVSRNSDEDGPEVEKMLVEEEQPQRKKRKVFKEEEESDYVVSSVERSVSSPESDGDDQPRTSTKKKAQAKPKAFKRVEGALKATTGSSSNLNPGTQVASTKKSLSKAPPSKITTIRGKVTNPLYNVSVPERSTDSEDDKIPYKSPSKPPPSEQSSDDESLVPPPIQSRKSRPKGAHAPTRALLPASRFNVPHRKVITISDDERPPADVQSAAMPKSKLKSKPRTYLNDNDELEDETANGIARTASPKSSVNLSLPFIVFAHRILKTDTTRPIPKRATSLLYTASPTWTQRQPSLCSRQRNRTRPRSHHLSHPYPPHPSCLKSLSPRRIPPHLTRWCLHLPALERRPSSPR